MRAALPATPAIQPHGGAIYRQPDQQHRPGSLPFVLLQANASKGQHTIEIAVNGTLYLVEPLTLVTNSIVVRANTNIYIYTDTSALSGAAQLGNTIVANNKAIFPPGGGRREEPRSVGEIRELWP